MRKGLIIIDMINGIAVNGSCSKYVKKFPVLNNVNQLISAFRKKGLPIYFVRLAFAEGYPDSPKHSKSFTYIRDNNKFLLGSDQVELMEGLNYQEGKDRVFNKTGANPFHHSGLSEALQKDGIEDLVFAGVATDNAINIGSRFANDEGYRTTVIKDACGAGTVELHENSLALLGKIVNKIMSTDDFLSALNASDTVGKKSSPRFVGGRAEEELDGSSSKKDAHEIETTSFS